MSATNLAADVRAARVRVEVTMILAQSAVIELNARLRVVEGKAPTQYRAGLMGSRRYGETRAAHARRHRELVYLNHRSRW